MLDRKKIQAQMEACKELQAPLVPKGSERPYWFPPGHIDEAHTNVSLEVWNRWAELNNCFHLWESALGFLEDGDIEAAEWCARWPQDVLPDFVAEINAKAGISS